MDQVIAFACRFWRKCHFALCSKSKMKVWIVKCTRNQMSKDLHHRTRESIPVPTIMIRCMCNTSIWHNLLPTGSSGWKFRNVDALCRYFSWCAFPPISVVPRLGLFMASDRAKRRVEWHVSRSQERIGLYIVHEVKYLIHCVMSRSIRIEFCWGTLSLRSILEWNIT